jgi:hypothetical protein
MLLIFVGVIVIAIFGSHDSSNRELPVLLCLFHNRAFVIYFGIVLLGVFILATGWKHPRSPLHVRPICAALLPGFIGGNQFFIKAVGEMVVIAADTGVTYFDSPGAYAISFFGVLFAVFQLVLMNMALRDYDTLLVVPLYSAALILTGSISGGVYFIEFDGLSTARWVGYWSGLGAVLAGVVIVFVQGKQDAGKERSSSLGSVGVIGVTVENGGREGMAIREKNNSFDRNPFV